MRNILPPLNRKSPKPLYLQIYDYIKSAIIKKEIAPMEKLPSMRNLSKSLCVSLTTVDLAYSQLCVEGYIFSKPQSGYYVSDMSCLEKTFLNYKNIPEHQEKIKDIKKTEFYYDLSCFDFVKWKKCSSKILNEQPHLLLFESDIQGEEQLRLEISKYVYQSRGVRCKPEQIVIAAGTQQITMHLSNIMIKKGINNVAVESPGYLPVINIFRDRGFAISNIAVENDGIDINKLPVNIPVSLYVNPSNQFPTGAVMPIGKRYKLLKWAIENNSYIIEDDYDSELRYFGNPIPSLQGLDNNERVIYLGSFCSSKN